MKKIALAIVLATLGFSAAAATDCTSTVASISADAGLANPGVTVTMTSGNTFVIPASDANFRALLSLAELGMTTKKNITARFAATGLACATATGRTDLVTLINAGGL